MDVVSRSADTQKGESSLGVLILGVSLMTAPREVVRDALRFMEERKSKLEVLQSHFAEGAA